MLRSTNFLVLIAAFIFLTCNPIFVDNLRAQDIFQATETFYTIANSGSDGDIEPEFVGDGDVDGADLAVFSNSLVPTPDARGDINQDGQVNNDDTALFSQQFGAF